MKIYVASSWRNMIQPGVVLALREAGYDVYDFKNPAPGDDGFHWSEIDGGWKEWDNERYIKALNHPIANDGFDKDMKALREADVTVLVLPCGRSAHLELGWAVGQCQRTAILLGDAMEPELMYKMVDAICTNVDELLPILEKWHRHSGDMK